jgi:NAD(P)-dependent dehydrogenase (short-subunit alcohol dehydrogenase family)
VSREKVDLRGRTVLVTGAARGIGAELARQLTARGARLALVGLEPEKLEALSDSLGHDAAWWEADVRDAAALETAITAAAERFGGLDVVVANAGIATVGTVMSVSPEDFERVIDVNLLGVYRTARAALPHLKRSRGYLLCVSSLAAAHHAPLMASYTASKAGVEAFGDALRTEAAVDGVTVGVAYFSFIDTDMVRDAFAESPSQSLREGVAARFTKPMPLDRSVSRVVRGIERRAKRIVVPRALEALVLAPGLLSPLLDRAASGGSKLEEAIRTAEQDR